jgi:hypothetical protein
MCSKCFKANYKFTSNDKKIHILLELVGLTVIHFQSHLSSGFQEFLAHDVIKVLRRKIPLHVSKNVINYFFRSKFSCFHHGIIHQALSCKDWKNHF